MCMYVCPCVGIYMTMPEDVIRTTGNGVTGSCNPVDLGAGNQTNPLQKQDVLLTDRLSLHPLFFNFKR